MNRLVWVSEFYCPPCPLRLSEINRALSANLANPALRDKHLFQHDLSWNKNPPYSKNNAAVNLHQIKHRFRFSDFLNLASDKRFVYILTNADIQLSWSLQHCELIQTDELWALSRWNNGEPPAFLDRSSQDTWILRGADFPKSLKEKCNFTLGVPGCDNAFAGIFKEAGYQVRNYSLSIRTDHHHASQLRTYRTEWTVPRPYYYPAPEKISLARRLFGRLRQAILSSRH